MNNKTDDFKRAAARASKYLEEHCQIKIPHANLLDVGAIFAGHQRWHDYRAHLEGAAATRSEAAVVPKPIDIPKPILPVQRAHRNGVGLNADLKSDATINLRDFFDAKFGAGHSKTLGDALAYMEQTQVTEALQNEFLLFCMQEHPEVIALPDIMPGNRRSGSTDPCDVLRGPCACGTWHSELCFPRVSFERLCQSLKQDITTYGVDYELSHFASQKHLRDFFDAKFGAGHIKTLGAALAYMEQTQVAEALQNEFLLFCMQEHPEVIALPDIIPGNRRSGSTDPCDVLRGPCACGTWHSELCFPRVSFERLCQSLKQDITTYGVDYELSHFASQKQATAATAMKFHDLNEDSPGYKLDDVVAEWVGLHYKKNFASESLENQDNWRARYKESMGIADDSEDNQNVFHGKPIQHPKRSKTRARNR